MSLDTLSDVLRTVRLRGAVFFHVSGHSDWAAEAPPGREIAPMLMPGIEHVMEYHAIVRGSCWAGIPGGPSVQLFAGDRIGGRLRPGLQAAGRQDAGGLAARARGCGLTACLD